MQRLGEQTATTPVFLCSYYLKEQMIAWQQETQKKKRHGSKKHRRKKAQTQCIGGFK